MNVWYVVVIEIVCYLPGLWVSCYEYILRSISALMTRNFEIQVVQCVDCKYCYDLVIVNLLWRFSSNVAGIKNKIGRHNQLLWGWARTCVISYICFGLLLSNTRNLLFSLVSNFSLLKDINISFFLSSLSSFILMICFASFWPSKFSCAFFMHH